MIVLLIGCHAQIHRINFGGDREAAETQLSSLKEILNKERWGSNGREQERTHTIKSPAGDVVVIIDKVEIARIVDCMADRAITATEYTTARQLALDADFDYRKRLADAGLLFKPV